MTSPSRPAPRANSDVLTATIDLDGRKVVDVGCGEGNLVRLMTRHGAKAFGVECNPEQLEHAHAATPAGGELYYEGRAEELPFADGSIDVVVFFNSLHHVAVAGMGTALDEAARVLKPGGLVYVCEPVADGPHFQLMRPVHDETDVRAAAYETLQNADAHGLEMVEEFTYVHPARHADFQQFKERMLRINPHRADDFKRLEGELQAAFDELGVDDGDGKDGRVFDQPMRVNLLKKA